MQGEDTVMENTKNVAAEFHQLDLIFRSGVDLDLVERRYTRKLILAISTQNDVSECEALKSLGDLYLHKAKMNTDKVENFHKACSLFTELLRYYTSVEKKQVVEHRIKYAEKCTKLVHGKEIVKVHATNSDKTISGVSKILGKVEKKTRFEGYTKSFVQAIVDRNKCLQVESLKSLGDLYLEKGRVGKDEAAFTRAAGLYQAALDRCEDSDGRETLTHRIKYAERVKEKVLKARRKVSKMMTNTRHVKVQEKLFQNGQAYWRDAELLGDGIQMDKLEFPDCSLEWKPLTDGTYSLTMKSKDPPCFPDFLRSDPRTEKVSQLHLSVNRMKKIPAGISIFSQVTDVKLDRNKLKSLTAEFTQLKKIKNLDLGNNVFRKFPEEIKEFCDLEVLRFSVNQVEEIPSGVFPHLPKLKNLRIGSNKLKSLPEDLAQLENLEYLKISSNKFSSFPPQLLQLPSIRQVCISGNKITEVPLEFFEKPLELFQAEDNPLQQPPLEVCSRGIEAIKSYCRQISESSENINDKRLKLVLLGEKGAGKTSLCHSLKEGTSRLADPDDRTVSINAHEITEGDVTFLTWDFAGQQDYLVTHPVFITKDALVLLVVNLERYRPDSVDSYRKHVGVWIENVAMRVPNAVVLVVGTHLDKIGQEVADKKLKDILRRIGEGEDERLRNISLRIAELEEKEEGGVLTPAEAETQLEPLRNKAHVKLRIWPVGISLSSGEGLLGFGRLREELMEIVTGQDYFAQVGRTIPRAWKEVENLLMDYKGRGDNSVFKHGDVKLSDAVELILRETEVRSREDAEEILRYLHGLGVIIWYHEIDCLKDRIFVDIFKVLGPPPWMLDKSMPVCSTSASKESLNGQLKGWTDWNGTLATLTVEHLQGFKDKKTVHLHPETTAIIGPNSSGKTTLIRAWLLFATLSYETSSRSSGKQGRPTSERDEHKLISNSTITDIFALADIRDFWYRRNTKKPVKISGIDTDENELHFIINYVTGGTLVRVDKTTSVKSFSHSHIGYSHRPVLAVMNNVKSDAYKPQVPVKVPVPSFPVVRLDHTLVFSMLCELQKDKTYWKWLTAMLESVLPGCAIRVINGIGCIGEKVIMVRERFVDIPLQTCDSGLLQIIAVLVFVLHSLKSFSQHKPFSFDFNRPIATLLLDDIAGFLGSDIFGKLSKCLTNRINCIITTSTLWDEVANECERKISLQGPSSKSHPVEDLMMVSIYGAGSAHPERARSLALEDLGNHKAVSYFEQSLQKMKSIHGEATEHPEITNLEAIYGNAWSDLGDHMKAVSYYEQALEMKLSIHGEGNAHPDIANSLNHLGNAWSHLGDHMKALSYFEQSLQMRQKIHGEDTEHPYIAMSLINLGNAWSHLGDYRKAVSYYEQALQMMRSIHGNTPHPVIAASLNNLGIAWSDLGDHRKAVSYYEQSLQMRRTIHVEDTEHPAIVLSLHNLAAANIHLGDHRKALSYQKQALQMMQHKMNSLGSVITKIEMG